MSSISITRTYQIGKYQLELCNNTKQYLDANPGLFLNPDFTCKRCGTDSALHLSEKPICGKNQSQLKRSKTGFCLDCFSRGMVCEVIHHPSQSYIPFYVPNSTSNSTPSISYPYLHTPQSYHTNQSQDHYQNQDEVFSRSASMKSEVNRENFEDNNVDAHQYEMFDYFLSQAKKYPFLPYDKKLSEKNLVLPKDKFCGLIIEIPAVNNLYCGLSTPGGFRQMILEKAQLLNIRGFVQRGKGLSAKIEVFSRSSILMNFFKYLDELVQTECISDYEFPDQITNECKFPDFVIYKTIEKTSLPSRHSEGNKDKDYETVTSFKSNLSANSPIFQQPSPKFEPANSQT